MAPVYDADYIYMRSSCQYSHDIGHGLRLSPDAAIMIVDTGSVSDKALRYVVTMCLALFQGWVRITRAAGHYLEHTQNQYQSPYTTTHPIRDRAAYGSAAQNRLVRHSCSANDCFISCKWNVPGMCFIVHKTCG